MIEPHYLTLRTKQARYTKRRHGNMSITRSINVAQTDDRVLKAGAPRDKQSDRYT